MKSSVRLLKNICSICICRGWLIPWLPCPLITLTDRVNEAPWAEQLAKAPAVPVNHRQQPVGLRNVCGLNCSHDSSSAKPPFWTLSCIQSRVAELAGEPWPAAFRGIYRQKENIKKLRQKRRNYKKNAPVLFCRNRRSSQSRVQVLKRK